MAGTKMQNLLYLVLIGTAAARPQAATTATANPGDVIAGIIGNGANAVADSEGELVQANPITSTVTPSVTVSTSVTPPSEVTADATPISGQSSYWWIDGSCNANTPDGESKYDFIKEAYGDAQDIANVAKQWPSKFTEASDLYVGNNFKTSKYAKDFQANIESASNFNTGISWPWSTWARLTCDDLYNACGGKIGSDPRSIAAYANNTAGSFGGVYYRITFCDPFFTINSVANIKKFFESTKPSDLQMIFMESSGEKFLHEAMHLDAISQKRGHIYDNTFDGGKRIYSPRDVAKAARIANREGFDKNWNNADTYAVFAQAAYWQDHFGVCPPPTVANAPAAPVGAFEFQGIQDSQDNYLELVESTWSQDPSSGDGGESKYECSQSIGIPLDAAKGIESDWKGQAGKKATVTAGLQCSIVGLSGNSQASLCGPDTGGSADYGDMATAFQLLIDNCNTDGNVDGSADVPNAPGLSVKPYADGIGGT